MVLANADLPYVYQNLLPQDGMVKALSRKRFSCSVISFFWGVDKTYRHPRYQNLYFVGASTHPGTGMPTAMVSGRLVAERMMDELGA